MSISTGDKPGTVITNSIGMKLALIPAGEFLMGSPDWELLAEDDEKRHLVRITCPFHLGIHVVTQNEWVTVMSTTPWTDEEHVKEGERYPATYVTWKEARKFCRKLTEKDRAVGRLDATESYRLPTEAEWEYACRAGSRTPFYFPDGLGPYGEYMWYERNAWDVDERYPHLVGQKRANAWGLLDMHGNVEEWCSDWYGKDYYGTSPEVNPLGPSKGSTIYCGPARVCRGGTWDMPFAFCRSALRSHMGASARDHAVGFRVVRTIAPSK